MTFRVTDMAVHSSNGQDTVVVWFDDDYLLGATSTGRAGYMSPGTFAEIKLMDPRHQVVAGYTPSRGFVTTAACPRDLVERWQAAYDAAQDLVERGMPAPWSVLGESHDALQANLRV